MKFKDKMLEKYSKLTDVEAYKKCAGSFVRKSFRVNTLKADIEGVKERLADFDLSPVPWCKEGFYINSAKRDIGKTEEHALGEIFVQTSVSMIPAQFLELKWKDLVLDVSASPGGKTEHCAQLMNNKGLIVANDISSTRLKPLIINLQRCSVSNTVVTQMDGRELKGEYDKILLDAPCSGSGMIRGPTELSKRTLEEWNPINIDKYAKLQKQLITQAYSLLKKNGIMVYSTCSLEPEENEEVVEYLLDNTNAKVEKINLNIKSSGSYLRIWPQDNDTEGFFVAKIRKI
ncbi:MAG: NOL1/NOP2/sun family putative RNA methylase [Candidatus Nanoarchaeia archaeon]|nr:NOL1/NOP2/sun family putative RNA methylase [Candidatus Nanoarchaeia archaeon]